MIYIFLFSDTFIQKTKKSYEDSRVRRNLNNINTELHDVQRIMVQNIDDVLQRGEALGGGFSTVTYINYTISRVVCYTHKFISTFQFGEGHSKS